MNASRVFVVRRHARPRARPLRLVLGSFLQTIAAPELWLRCVKPRVFAHLGTEVTGDGGDGDGGDGEICPHRPKCRFFLAARCSKRRGQLNIAGFRECPRLRAQGRRSTRWLRFFRTPGAGGIGFVAQKVCTFRHAAFAHCTSSQPLGSYFQSVRTVLLERPRLCRVAPCAAARPPPALWVRCAARRLSHWVRFFSAVAA